MQRADLGGLTLYINSKISRIKRSLLLRNIVQVPNFKSIFRETRQEFAHLLELLNEMELALHQQENLRDSLQELQKRAERDLNGARHLLKNIPFYRPKPTKNCTSRPTVQREEQTKAVETKCAQKPAKEPRAIKEVPLLTVEEFSNVPAYLKGRLTYDNINSVILDINKAVLAKYNILHKPLKSLKAKLKVLYHRFVEEETKETKDGFFIVEKDLREFTQLKLDKKFYSVIAILRHCHRVREVRSSKLVRYIIC